ncbi:MAG: rRNA pseudouridine synthase [Proteobacteria bacterium]|nr:rRNA pseudouridine synthase [Pseudomonadota bacterium]
MALIRLQKYLALSGICSRRKGETCIQEGMVSVNGQIVTEMGFKVDPVKDVVAFQGNPVKMEQAPVYIALNKPVGYVSSCNQRNVKIVLDLVNDLPGRIYPIGRLDKDSTGLLLLTNDGRLHHQLSHPSFDHEKEYEVQVMHPISDDTLSKMASGIPLDGVMTRRAEIKRVSTNRFRIVLKEGKNRQIRRMVKHVGNEVQSLKRLRISTITLGRLKEGAWRYLTPEEKNGLLGRIGLSSKRKS